MALRKRHIALIASFVLLASCKQRVDQASQIRATSSVSVEKLKRGLVNHHRDFTNKYAEIMRDVERTTSKRLSEIIRLVPGVKSTANLFKPFRNQTTTADRLRSLASIQSVIEDSYKDLLERDPKGFNSDFFMALMEPYWAKTALVHRLAGTSIGIEADQLLTGLGNGSILADIVVRTKATLNEHISYALSRMFLGADGKLSPQLAGLAQNALAGLEKADIDAVYANALMQFQGMRTAVMQNNTPSAHYFDKVLDSHLGSLKNQISNLLNGSKQNLKKVLAQYAVQTPPDSRKLYASSNTNSANYNWKHDQSGRIFWYIGNNKHNPIPGVGLTFGGSVGGGGHAQANFYPLYQPTNEPFSEGGRDRWHCSLTQILMGVGTGAGLVYGPSFNLAGALQEIPISFLPLDHGAGLGMIGILGVSGGATAVGLTANFSITGGGDRFYIIASLNAQFSGPTVPGGIAYFGAGEAFHYNTCGDESLEYLEI